MNIDKSCEACVQGKHDKCILKVPLPFIKKDDCWCEQCVIEQTNETLDKTENEMVEILSVMDWGNSFLKLKLKAPKEVKDKIDKLSAIRQDDIGTVLNSALRQIEEIINL